MARPSKNPPRKPATKFAHLRKKLQKAQTASKKTLPGGRAAKGKG